MSSCTYRFISSSLAEIPAERDYELIIRQQPVQAKMSVPNERDRRPIEPSPIIQMRWLGCSTDETKKWLQSPFYYMVANLIPCDASAVTLPSQDLFSGSAVSSLYRLRDVDDTDGGFFVFGDLAVKKEGQYRLHFSLFEVFDGHAENRKTIVSEPFTVYLPKRYPGAVESTFLSQTFSDQGVKIRMRKEYRLQSSPNGRKRKNQPPQTQSLRPLAKHEEPPPCAKKLALPAYFKPNTQHVYLSRWQSSSKPVMTSKPPPVAPSYSSSRFATPSLSPPSTCFQQPYSMSPPSSIISTSSASFIHSLPAPSSLENYHLCRDTPPPPRDTFTPSLTPPPAIEDISKWGAHLPPLRSIMSDSMPNHPLLLPLPFPVEPRHVDLHAA